MLITLIIILVAGGITWCVVKAKGAKFGPPPVFPVFVVGVAVLVSSYLVSYYPDSEVPSVRRNLQSWGANCSSEKPETHILVRLTTNNSAIFVFQPQDTKYSDYFTIERVPSTRAKTFVTEGQPYVIVRESGDVLRCRWSWWWWVQHNHSRISHEFHIPAGGLKH